MNKCELTRSYTSRTDRVKRQKTAAGERRGTSIEPNKSLARTYHSQRPQTSACIRNAKSSVSVCAFLELTPEIIRKHQSFDGQTDEFEVVNVNRTSQIHIDSFRNRFLPGCSEVH
jgi:hypothetical protein